MKMFLAILLAAVMVFSLAACGSDDEASETASTSGAEETEETSGEAETSEDAAAEITTIEEGKLTISTSPDFPPYEYLNDDGEPEGIEIEILGIVAEELGLELVIDEMDFDGALLAVQQGKSDMVVSGVTVTEDRKLVMDFTDSYTTAVQVIVVPEGSDVTLDTLGDYSIGTQRGTTGYIYCVDDYGEDSVIGYDTYTLVIQALLNGQVDCVVMDDAVAREYVEANQGLTILDTEYAVEEYAFGCTKGNTALVDAVNEVLAELTADGTIDEIIDRYIND